MDITRAKELLSALADGIDPFTENSCRKTMYAINLK